jgi:hypothetical protein
MLQNFYTVTVNAVSSHSCLVRVKEQRNLDWLQISMRICHCFIVVNTNSWNLLMNNLGFQYHFIGVFKVTEFGSRSTTC